MKALLLIDPQNEFTKLNQATRNAALYMAERINKSNPKEEVIIIAQSDTENEDGWLLDPCIEEALENREVIYDLTSFSLNSPLFDGQGEDNLDKICDEITVMGENSATGLLTFVIGLKIICPSVSITIDHAGCMDPSEFFNEYTMKLLKYNGIKII